MPGETLKSGYEDQGTRSGCVLPEIAKKVPTRKKGDGREGL